MTPRDPSSRRTRGYSLLEMVVAVALLGLVVLIITILERERHQFEQSSRLEWMKHPEPLEVLARFRRDVLDSSDSYPGSFGTYTQTPKTLILSSTGEDGKPVTIVWDFTVAGAVTRMEFKQPDTPPSLSWTAHGVPKLTVSSYAIDPSDPNAAVAVRLTGKDDKGNTLIDEVAYPRTHS